MLSWIVALLAMAPSAQNITLTVKGDTVAHVVSQIAEQTRLPLQTKAPIQHQMLLIDVKDAGGGPRARVLHRQAHALAGVPRVLPRENRESVEGPPTLPL